MKAFLTFANTLSCCWAALQRLFVPQNKGEGAKHCYKRKRIPFICASQSVSLLWSKASDDNNEHRVTKRNLATVQVLCRTSHWRPGRASAASTLQNPAITAAPWEERGATRRCGWKTCWQHVPTAHLKKSLIWCVFKLEIQRAFLANTQLFWKAIFPSKPLG